MVDKLYVVLSSSPNRDWELCERDGVKYMPAEVRMSWIGQTLADIENVELINIIDDHWNDDYDWEEGSNMIKAAIPEPITHVFSSELEYDIYFSKYYPGAKHVVIDAGRKAVPISATELRRDIYGHWEMLPTAVRPFFVKRIAVVGTESCGKSTLTAKLAKFFNTNYVHEVGRDYCIKYKNMLTQDKFNSIAMSHLLLQDTMSEESNKMLFVDSEAVVTQYYLDMYSKKNGFTADGEFIDSIIKLQKFDLVLYMEPDVDWVDDGYRFMGSNKERYDNNITLKNMFAKYGIQYTIISGNYSERFNKACMFVKQLFTSIYQ